MDVGEREERQLAREKLNNIYGMEDFKCRQRAKVKQVKKGARNTKYFLIVATTRKKGNTLSKFLTDDELEEAQEAIAPHLENYKEPYSWIPSSKGST